MSAVPTTAKALARRERLLEAAIRVFGRLGFARATLSAIADEADLNKATLYYYFPGGKDELLRLAIRKHAEDSFQRIQAAMASTTTPVERLRAYLRGRVTLYIEKVRGSGITFEALYELMPIAEAQCAEWIGREVGQLASLLQACRPDADLDWLEHARTLSSAIKGVLLDLRPTATDADITRRADALESLIISSWG